MKVSTWKKSFPSKKISKRIERKKWKKQIQTFFCCRSKKKLLMDFQFLVFDVQSDFCESVKQRFSSKALFEKVEQKWSHRKSISGFSSDLELSFCCKTGWHTFFASWHPVQPLGPNELRMTAACAVDSGVGGLQIWHGPLKSKLSQDSNSCQPHLSFKAGHLSTE